MIYPSPLAEFPQDQKFKNLGSIKSALLISRIILGDKKEVESALGNINKKPLLLRVNIIFNCKTFISPLTLEMTRVGGSCQSICL